MSIIDRINCSNDVKSLTRDELNALCRELREFEIESIAKTGGHLASNLGTVELTVALHRVYDTAVDRLVFDVGHQSYTHKILTGRKAAFGTLRQYGGLSGFPKPYEAVDDAFIAGHASNSVSVALGMARASFSEEEWLYKTFGVDAEILIDHAFGIEPCTIQHIKEYRPEFNSICEGQVLPCPYSYEKARIIVREMVDSLVFQLVERKAVTDSLTLTISYDRESVDNGSYRGEIYIDHYGRKIPVGAHGTVKLDAPSNLSSQLMAAVMELFERITDKRLTVRRVMLNANRIFPDTGVVQIDLFTDTAKLEKEKRLQETMLAIKKKYSKIAILKGVNFEEGATMRERNNQIGGHKK